jgi:hypothetical protein
MPPDVVLSFDIEQVLNIGSQSSGAGAGKVTFNPFSIRRSRGSLRVWPVDRRIWSTIVLLGI